MVTWTYKPLFSDEQDDPVVDHVGSVHIGDTRLDAYGNGGMTVAIVDERGRLVTTAYTAQEVAQFKAFLSTCEEVAG